VASSTAFRLVCSFRVQAATVLLLTHARHSQLSRGSTRQENDNCAHVLTKFLRVLLITIRILGAPRIWIVGHRVGAYLLSFVGAFGRPLRIVKL
jgi:hypothetical protein